GRAAVRKRDHRWQAPSGGPEVWIGWRIEVAVHRAMLSRPIDPLRQRYPISIDDHLGGGFDRGPGVAREAVERNRRRPVWVAEQCSGPLAADIDRSGGDVGGS